MNVMIGIDPHKASHTAAAIDPAESDLGQLRVRAAAGQVERLLAWAEAWPERTWAVENAGGLGYLLAQQLFAAGEQVLDVPPKLAARVRLLATGDINKNDPNDARSVAIAALRSPAVKPVVVEDHQAVMKVWAKRHRDLGRCRHPAGVPPARGALRAGARRRDLQRTQRGQGEKVLAGIEARRSRGVARYQLAEAFIDDLRRIDEQIRDTKKRIAAAVTASKTTVTEIFGAGPVVAAMVKGDVGDVRRFASRDRFASYNGTAPIEVSSGPKKIYRLSRRGNRRMNHAIHIIAVTQLRFPNTEGRAYFERKLAEGKTGKEALRSLKRRISDQLYARLLEDARREDAARQRAVREGTRGTSLHPARPAHTPRHRLFGKATPGPPPSLRPPAPPAPDHPTGDPKNLPPRLLTNKEDSFGRGWSLSMTLFCMSILKAPEYAGGGRVCRSWVGWTGPGSSLSSVGRSRRCRGLGEAGRYGGGEVLLVVGRVAQEAVGRDEAVVGPRRASFVGAGLNRQVGLGVHPQKVSRRWLGRPAQVELHGGLTVEVVMPDHRPAARSDVVSDLRGVCWLGDG